ncbi:MAG: hypothetical protein ACRERV_00560, partial [Methylococcales bacterium]
MNYSEFHQQKALVVFNTLGMTGVELLIGELSMVPGLLVLPGQNFIECAKQLYRPHDHSGRDEESIFAELSLIQKTKTGMIWAGLNKFFTQEDALRYTARKHKDIFCAKLRNDPQIREHFFDLIFCYVATFFVSCGVDIERVEAVGFYSGNVALNTPWSDPVSERVIFIQMNPSIDIWLTLSGRTKTWNSVSAIKFWIINQLFLLHFSEKHKKFLFVDYSRPLTDEVLEECRRKVVEFLCLNDSDVGTLSREEQAIRTMGHVDPGKLKHDDVAENCAFFDKIYSSCPFYALARTMKEWGPAFLRDPVNQCLLQRFQSFWQTTSHTNFDWIGTVGDKLILKAMDANHGSLPVESANDLNVNYLLYHTYSSLDSDHHDAPNVSLEHYLGNLEEDIVIPKLPYYM